MTQWWFEVRVDLAPVPKIAQPFGQGLQQFGAGGAELSPSLSYGNPKKDHCAMMIMRNKNRGQARAAALGFPEFPRSPPPSGTALAVAGAIGASEQMLGAEQQIPGRGQSD
jgi:hypothetical protein